MLSQYLANNQDDQLLFTVRRMHRKGITLPGRAEDVYTLKALERRQRHLAAKVLAEAMVERGQMQGWGYLFRHLDTTSTCGKQGEVLNLRNSLRNRWSKFIQNPSQVPTEGECADEIWVSALNTALAIAEPFCTPNQKSNLRDMWEFAQSLQSREKRSWLPFRETVIGYLLEKVNDAQDGEVAAENALLWHWELCHEEPLRQEAWTVLVKNARSDRAEKTLKNMHARTISTLRANGTAANGLDSIREPRYVTGFYEAIMLRASRLGQLKEASEWHEYCMNVDEAPLTTEPANRLLLWYMRWNPGNPAIQRLLSSLVDAGAELVESTLLLFAFYFAKGKRKDVSSIMKLTNMVNKEHAQTVLSDQFWAIAIRACSESQQRSAVMSKMAEFGLEPGPLIFEALIRTEYSVETVEKLIRELVTRGFTITTTMYASLARLLSKQGHVKIALQIVRTVVDTAGASDEGLMRSVLRGLMDVQNWDELENVHKLMVADKLANERTWNLLIRARAERGELRRALQGLEELLLKSFSVEASTAHALVKRVLDPEEPALGDSRFAEVLGTSRRSHKSGLQQAIEIGVACMRAGGHVHPETWKMLLFKLAKECGSNIKSLDSLCLWLIRQYTPEAKVDETIARTQAPGGENLSIVKKTMERKAGDPVNILHRRALEWAQTKSYVALPKDVTRGLVDASTSAVHPLRRIFTPPFLSACLYYSFNTGAMRNPIYLRMDQTANAVKMLSRWQDLGVHIDDRVISRNLRVLLKKWAALRPKVTPDHVTASVRRLEKAWKKELVIQSDPHPADTERKTVMATDDEEQVGQVT
ncbi:hypothetical protein YB2330_000645 [Saitoella coloradoensis]